MYKIVEELVPTLPTEQFIKFQKQKCQTSTNKYQDCETSNIFRKTHVQQLKKFGNTRQQNPTIQKQFFS